MGQRGSTAAVEDRSTAKGPPLPPPWLAGVESRCKKTRQQGGERPDAVKQDKSPRLLLCFQSYHSLRSNNPAHWQCLMIQGSGSERLHLASRLCPPGEREVLMWALIFETIKRRITTKLIVWKQAATAQEGSRGDRRQREWYELNP